MYRRVLTTKALVSAVVLVFGFSGSAARAAGWADACFGALSHDFGAVPRGAKVRHNFVLTNRLNEPITILNVRASCGCTTGRATSPVVPPGQSAAIEAEMDTRNFVGKKATVLYVTLVNSAGREGEVRLGVSSTILSDIVLNPGTIDFGVVGRGQTPTLALSMERVGMAHWEVHRMISTCKAIDATLSETGRDDRTVAYALKVSLRPDAPAGVIRDEIRLLSNDPDAPVFAVQVTAILRGDLSASPSVLALGQATSTAEAQGKFLVRSSRAFTVRAIEGEGNGFKASVDDDSSKPVHIVTVSYKPDPGQARGDLRHVFRLHTDLVGEPPLDLPATLHAMP